MRGVLLACALLPALARAEPPVPSLTGPVVDQAGLLSAGSAQRLADLCRAARAMDGGRGPQLQYLLVSSLQGEAIESFSMRVAEAWKIGTKGLDNGVLLTVAIDDRKVRIEVGGGLEGQLTDVQAGRIIRNTLAPAFRARRYGEGLHAAGVEILSAVGGLPAGVERPAAGPVPVQFRQLGGAAFSVLLVIAVVTIVILRAFFALGGGRRRFYGSTWGTGSSWGSGSRWGGGGGGGWSGGGGGFSGGGASGGW